MFLTVMYLVSFLRFFFFLSQKNDLVTSFKTIFPSIVNHEFTEIKVGSLS